MAIISAELLDALLSSGPSRQEAEAHFHSLSLTDRIQGLVAVLSTPTKPNHILISSVLLRRDIATLGGEVLQQHIVPGCAFGLLKSLGEPLLQLFQSLPSALCRRQVGYCLTEVICSLSLVSPQDSQNALQSILTTISPLVRHQKCTAVLVMSTTNVLMCDFVPLKSVTMPILFRSVSWPIWQSVFPAFSARRLPILWEYFKLHSSPPQVPMPRQHSRKQFATWPLPLKWLPLDSQIPYPFSPLLASTIFLWIRPHLQHSLECHVSFLS